MISVSVLGPVELRRDGEPAPLRPGKTTEVLIRLAVEAGVPVGFDRLIADLWGDEAVTTSRNTLQTKISRLRKELGDGDLLIRRPAGYALAVDPDAVDAIAVTRLAEVAAERLRAGDAAGAAETAAGALARFRGEILVDAGDHEWVVPYRARLEEVRLRLVEDELAARLELGAAGAVVGELEQLVAEHPLREGLWALLITALYRDGRQADALAAYTRVREQLAEELGLDPGPALRALEQQVLLQDPALAPSRSAQLARPVAGNVPALASPLVGRTIECEEVGALLEGERLVTLAGAAGVGKTRLAIELAQGAVRDAGAWLVRLDSALSPDAVVETVTAALGVAGGTVPVLLEHVRGSDALLVLDNCEHVVDAVADLVPALLGAGERLTVLCTSQVPLGLDGECVYSLDPLPLDDSVALFTSRAVAHRRSFAVDEESVTTLEEVCTALDGLPLAIELAAARTKTLSLPEIARRLDDRFALLRDPNARRPERQRALDAAITWSYDLLFPDDQRGVWALACFAGGAPLAAVEHVLAGLDVPPASAIDVVSRLADRSLVSVDVGADGELRYRLLDSVRAYGADRLVAEGLDDTGRAAHAHWYAAAAERVDAEVRGPAQAAQLAVARAERANVDAALDWARDHEPALALRIASGFGWAWVVIGEAGVGAARLRRALAAAGEGAPATARVSAWCSAAWLEAGVNVERAAEAAAAAVAVASASGDGALLATAQLAEGFVLIQQGRPGDALERLTGCRQSFAAADDTWSEGAACILTAHAAFFLGDAATAAAASADGETLVHRTGDGWGIDHLEATLGRLALVEGRVDDATAHLEAAIAAARRLGFATSEGYHLANLGRARELAGDADGAVVAFEQAVEIGRRTAELRLAALARVRLGQALLATGDRGRARAELATAGAWYRGSGGGDGARLGAAVLAVMDAEDGEPGAEARLEAALDEARAAGDPEVETLLATARDRLVER